MWCVLGNHGLGWKSKVFSRAKNVKKSEEAHFWELQVRQVISQTLYELGTSDLAYSARYNYPWPRVKSKLFSGVKNVKKWKGLYFGTSSSTSDFSDPIWARNFEIGIFNSLQSVFDNFALKSKLTNFTLSHGFLKRITNVKNSMSECRNTWLICGCKVRDGDFWKDIRISIPIFHDTYNHYKMTVDAINRSAGLSLEAPLDRFSRAPQIIYYQSLSFSNLKSAYKFFWNLRIFVPSISRMATNLTWGFFLIFSSTICWYCLADLSQSTLYSWVLFGGASTFNFNFQLRFLTVS